MDINNLTYFTLVVIIPFTVIFLAAIRLAIVFGPRKTEENTKI